MSFSTEETRLLLEGAPGRDADFPGLSPLLDLKFKPMPLDVDGEPAIDGYAGFPGRPRVELLERSASLLPPAEFAPYVPPPPPTFWQRLRSILGDARWRYGLAWRLVTFQDVTDDLGW